jgi:anti-sigma-K factor RskA
MNKNSMSDEQKLDEKIAEFTDLVLGADEEVEMNDVDQTDELIRLQKTILQMKTAVQRARPDETTRARIHRNLLLATAQKPHEKELRGRKSFSGIAMASGFALLVLLAVILLPLSGVNTSLPGTADGSPVWVPFAIIAGMIGIAIITWLNRKR